MELRIVNHKVEVSLEAQEEITLRVRGGYKYRIETPPTGLSAGLAISPVNFSEEGVQVEQVMIDKPGFEGRVSEVRLFV